MRTRHLLLVGVLALVTIGMVSALDGITGNIQAGAVWGSDGAFSSAAEIDDVEITFSVQADDFTKMVISFENNNLADGSATLDSRGDLPALSIDDLYARTDWAGLFGLENVILSTEFGYDPGGKYIGEIAYADEAYWTDYPSSVGTASAVTYGLVKVGYTLESGTIKATFASPLADPSLGVAGGIDASFGPVTAGVFYSTASNQVDIEAKYTGSVDDFSYVVAANSNIDTDDSVTTYKVGLQGAYDAVTGYFGLNGNNTDTVSAFDVAADYKINDMFTARLGSLFSGVTGDDLFQGANLSCMMDAGATDVTLGYVFTQNGTGATDATLSIPTDGGIYLVVNYSF